MNKLSFKLRERLRRALLDSEFDREVPEAALAGAILFLQRQGCDIVIGDQVSGELRKYLEPLLRTKPQSKHPSLY